MINYSGEWELEGSIQTAHYTDVKAAESKWYISG